MDIPTHVLLIDSNAEDRVTLTHVLEGMASGFSITAVESWADITGDATQQPFGLIICDAATYHSSPEIIANCNRNNKTNSTVLIHAADMNDSAVINAMQNGADDYVLKDRPQFMNMRLAVLKLLATGSLILSGNRSRLSSGSADADRVKRFFSDFNACLLSFESRPSANIQKLTQLCGETLQATCAMYNRLDSGMLCTLGGWSTPPDLQMVNDPDGYICYDVIRRAGGEMFFAGDLKQSSYATSDPRVGRYNVNTYIGHAVKIGEVYTGSLCALFTGHVTAGEFERNVLSMLAAAIGVEENRQQVDSALRTSDSRFRALLETLPGIAVYGFDTAGTVLYWNKASQELYGYSAKEALGNAIDRLLIPENDRAVFREELQKAVRTARLPEPSEHLVRHKDGSIIPIFSSTCYIDRPQQSPEFFSVAMDLRELRRAEAALVESEERYRDLVEKAEIAILVDDARGSFSYFNQTFADLFGFTQSEMSTKSIQMLVHPDDLPMVMAAHTSHFKGSTRDSRYEFRGIRKNGTIIYLEVAVSLLWENGRVNGTRSFLWDISERKRAEAIQRVTNAIAQAATSSIELTDLLSMIHKEIGVLFDATNFVVALFDDAKQTYSFPYVSAEGEEPAKYDREQLKKSLIDFVRRTEKPFWADKAIRKERVASGDISRIGRACSCWMGVPLKTLGRIIGVISLQTYREGEMYSPEDFSLFAGLAEHIAIAIDRQQTLDALRHSEEQFREIVQLAPEGIYEMDLSHRLVLVNRQALEYFGYDEREIAENKPDALSMLIPEDRERALGTIRRLLEGEVITGHEYTGLRKDGSTFPANIHSSVIMRHGKAIGVRGIVTDLTDIKRTERALQESEERFRTLQNNIPIGVFRSSPEGRMLYANPAIIRMYGYDTLDEILQVPAESLFRDQERRRELIQRLDREDSVLNYEVEMIRRDGRVIWVSLSVYAVRDDSGALVHLDGVEVDITEQKRAEMALRASEQFNRAVIEHSPLGVSVRSRTGRLLAYNQAWQEIWDVCEESIEDYMKRERTRLEFDDRDSYLAGRQEDVRRIYEQGGYLYIPDMPLMKVREGGVHWVSQHFYAIQDENGRVDRVVILTEDTTKRKQAEEELLQTNQLLEKIVETSPAIITVYDVRSRRTIYQRRSLLQSIGYSPEQAQQYRHGPRHHIMTQILHPDDRDKADEFLRVFPTLKDGESYEMEYRFREPTGGWRWIRRISAVCLRDAEGTPTHAVHVNEDVTARKNAEEMLYRSFRFEKLIVTMSTRFINIPYEAMEEAINDALRTIGDFEGADHSYIWLLRQDGHYYDQTHEWTAERARSQMNRNQGICIDDLPYFADRLRKHEVLCVSRLDEMPAVTAIERDFLEQRYIKSFIMVPMVSGDTPLGILGFDTVSREILWSEENISLLKIAADTLTSAIIRNRAEQALRHSEERFRLAFNTSPDAILITRLKDGVYVDINDGFTAITGYTRKELIGNKQIRKRIWNIDEIPKELMTELIKTGRFENFETEMICKDGSTIKGLMSATIIELYGEPHILSVTRDISKLRDAEMARRHSEERYLTLQTNIPVGVFRSTAEGRIVSVNPAMVRMFGCKSEAELLAVPEQSLYCQPERREELLHLLDTRNSVTGFESQMRRCDGQVIWVSSNMRAVRDESGRMEFLEGTAEDITLRKQANQDLRESEEKFRNLYEKSPIGVALYDHAGSFIDANRACQTILGVSSVETMRSLNLFADPTISDVSKDKLREGRPVNYEIPFDFEKIKAKTLFATSRSGVIFLDVSITPLGSVGGSKAGGFLVQLNDITERKQVENAIRAATHEKYQQAKRIAGVFAHEVRNALFPAAAALNRLKTGAARNPNIEVEHIKKYAAIAERAITNAARTTRLISSYNKLDSEIMAEHVNISEVMREVIHNHQMEIDDCNITISVSGAPDILVVSNRRQLSVALNNIFINALQAVEDTDTPAIVIAWQEQGEFLELSIADNGHGIPDDIRSYIFELFFSTRMEAGGTGVGLPTARKISEMYGGSIDVTFREDGLTTFSLRLRLAARQE